MSAALATHPHRPRHRVPAAECYIRGVWHGKDRAKVRQELENDRWAYLSQDLHCHLFRALSRGQAAVVASMERLSRGARRGRGVQDGPEYTPVVVASDLAKEHGFSARYIRIVIAFLVLGGVLVRMAQSGPDARRYRINYNKLKGLPDLPDAEDEDATATRKPPKSEGFDEPENLENAKNEVVENTPLNEGQGGTLDPPLHRPILVISGGASEVTARPDSGAGEGGTELRLQCPKCRERVPISVHATIAKNGELRVEILTLPTGSPGEPAPNLQQRAATFPPAANRADNADVTALISALGDCKLKLTAKYDAPLLRGILNKLAGSPIDEFVAWVAEKPRRLARADLNHGLLLNLAAEFHDTIWPAMREEELIPIPGWGSMPRHKAMVFLEKCRDCDDSELQAMACQILEKLEADR